MHLQTLRINEELFCSPYLKLSIIHTGVKQEHLKKKIYNYVQILSVNRRCSPVVSLCEMVVMFMTDASSPF